MRNKIKLMSKNGHFYTTIKNKKNSLKKIQLKKYNPKLRKHVIYTEEKIK